MDVTIRLGKVTPTRLAAALERQGFKLRADDPSFVRTTRVLPVLHTRTSVPADLVLAGPGLEDAFLERAVTHDLGGLTVPVACAEDLIVMKILAGREKDLADVASILIARTATLDVNAISQTLLMIETALGQSDLVPTWERLRTGRTKNAKKKPAKRPREPRPTAAPALARAGARTTKRSKRRVSKKR